MKEVTTKDGSTTFYNDEYSETYHSVTGAVEEAFRKFAEPALEAVKNKNEVRILDVCFGLGYNSAAAIDEILKQNISCNIEIIGLEKDKKILEQIKNVEPAIISYPVIKEMVEQNYKYERNGIIIELIIGDALKTIKKIKGKFDIIFLDPFSPKKNPELWTESFFKELRKHIKEDGILTTYSCAGNVRRNLKAAGFEIKDGPCVGRRSPSTIATIAPVV
ncbi:tRNA (5-methylaminomethyl-2-thiouridine)(34)-methyltransferase MnmD [Candidatus Woesearchaeota archaeon]|nr:tRNA (5-methylaminomethyl-2-thiouridine)(34)-methyltransferase MnmD [Candidatus Woesearchaeota archaeon]